MTRPSDIPQDVWDAAENAFDTLLCNDIQASGTPEQFRIDSITPVARAILAERARCALIAENETLSPPQRNTKTVWVEQIGASVAAAIRKGGA